ncbi:MAG TPA: FIST N-terminal domain-containing protein [Acidimicrobiia bacterium]|jgi:small ligand-binding sensory domain FIST|nr:FIST N-terminal domain-containing protein [Acidimicrobiia bacterium]
MTPSRFAAALSEHPVASHAVGETAGEIMERFGGDEPDLVVCFASPHFVGAMEDLAFALGNLLEPRVMLGATAVAVAGGPREVEDGPALSVFAASLPDARLTPAAFGVEQTADGAAITGWPDLDHIPSNLLLLADPFSFPVDGFLRRLNDDAVGDRVAPVQVIGGAASAARGPGGNRLVLDSRVTSAGAVGAFVDGVEVRTVVSQGCRPVGQPYVVTRGEGNRIEELAGRAAIERVQDTASEASEEDRSLMRAGLHLGVVVDEHQTDFLRGDFLVRNVLGGDPGTGAIVVGDDVSVGQTVQFQVRDAAAADEDLRELLSGVEADAALLFTCNGRGRRFFGVPDHDAGVLDQLLGPLPVAGAFCAGEVGPVGGQNFLHGFTASVALF